MQAQEPKQIVQEALNTELAAERSDHTCWIFHEADRKPKNSVVQWVAETPKGRVARVLPRTGPSNSGAGSGRGHEQMSLLSVGAAIQPQCWVIDWRWASLSQASQPR